MIYLVAIFIPPLYFLLKKKWLAFIGSMIAFFFAFIFAVMFLIPVTLILWALCSVVAVWDLRKRVMHENAEVLATEIAEKMHQPPVAK